MVNEHKYISWGRKYGYPECCIKEFLEDADHVLIGRNKIFLDGKMNVSGFIPCRNHTQQVISKEITLSSLINNRDVNISPFKEHWE